MKIQTNTSASFALNYMSVNEKNTQQSIQRLSSGFRINRAGDDAAGLAIANKLRSDGKGLGQAQKNVAQASSMLQVMDGATQTVSSILDRMKELSTQANSANIGNQSGQLQKEFTQLSGEIDRIASTTNYQGTKLLDGSFGSGVDASATGTASVFKGAGALTNAVSVSSSPPLSSQATKVAVSYDSATSTLTFTPQDAASATQGTAASVTLSAASKGTTVSAGNFTFAVPSDFDLTGAAGSASTLGAAGGASFQLQKTGSFQVSSSGSYAFGGNDQIQVRAVDVSSSGLGLTGLDLTSQDGAAKALSALDAATNTVSTSLGSIGSAESRLDFASTNVATALQNTNAAESTIRDTDMAAEMTNFTKNNVLTQAAQSMLSQANQGTQGILTLLRG